MAEDDATKASIRNAVVGSPTAIEVVAQNRRHTSICSKQIIILSLLGYIVKKNSAAFLRVFYFKAVISFLGYYFIR